MPMRGANGVTTILLSLAGLVLAIVATAYLVPRLKGSTVTQTVTTMRPVVEQRVVTRNVKVEGRDVEAQVPETASRAVAETSTQTVTVEPTDKERIWLYGMLIMGGFLGLFSVGTSIIWFYFVVKKDGEAPAAVTEMLKYLVASFMGIFVGFMGGSSLSEGKPAPAQAPAPAASAPQ